MASLGKSQRRSTFRMGFDSTLGFATAWVLQQQKGKQGQTLEKKFSRFRVALRNFDKVVAEYEITQLTSLGGIPRIRFKAIQTSSSGVINRVNGVADWSYK